MSYKNFDHVEPVDYLDKFITKKIDLVLWSFIWKLWNYRKLKWNVGDLLNGNYLIPPAHGWFWYKKIIVPLINISKNMLKLKAELVIVAKQLGIVTQNCYYRFQRKQHFPLISVPPFFLWWWITKKKNKYCGVHQMRLRHCHSL